MLKYISTCDCKSFVNVSGLIEVIKFRNCVKKIHVFKGFLDLKTIGNVSRGMFTFNILSLFSTRNKCRIIHF